MARKKVALRYIRNDSTRLNTLKKRTKNLMKKAGDVATLCNAKACVLVYGEGTTVPEVFPSQAEAVAILNRFKSMTEVPQLKKTGCISLVNSIFPCHIHASYKHTHTHTQVW